jgi:hypothetical protein
MRSIFVSHPIYRVIGFEIVSPYTLKIDFDDGTSQTISFRSILEGELLGPLADEAIFDQVRIDPEVHTLVWPNGADFDPAVLHDWPDHKVEFEAMAKRWSQALAEN